MLDDKENRSNKQIIYKKLNITQIFNFNTSKYTLN